MFGLTRREQCWAAEQQAAELIAGVAKAALLAKTEIAKADANAALSAALVKVEELEKDRSACWAEFKVMTRSCLDAEKERSQALAQRDQLATLLRELFNDYKRLADSGDAGNWKLEETNIGSKVLAALSDLQPLAKSALPTERSGQIRSTPR